MIKLELMDFCHCDCDSFEASVEHAKEENKDIAQFFFPEFHFNTIISCKHINQCQKMMDYLKKAARD